MKKIRRIGHFEENEVLVELYEHANSREKMQKTELHYLQKIWFYCHVTKLI